MNKYNLEDRLVNFSVSIIDIVDELTSSKAANHLGSQIVRSGTAVALIYGEAQSGESRRDFIHKMKLVLKELRETFICTKIIEKAKLFENHSKLKKAKDECNKLISIFVKSIETAEKNNKKKFS